MNQYFYHMSMSDMSVIQDTWRGNRTSESSHMFDLLCFLLVLLDMMVLLVIEYLNAV